MRYRGSDLDHYTQIIPQIGPNQVYVLYGSSDEEVLISVDVENFEHALEIIRNYERKTKRCRCIEGKFLKCFSFYLNFGSSIFTNVKEFNILFCM